MSGLAWSFLAPDVPGLRQLMNTASHCLLATGVLPGVSCLPVPGAITKKHFVMGSKHKLMIDGTMYGTVDAAAFVSCAVEALRMAVPLVPM
jgi:hypothetical protein